MGVTGSCCDFQEERDIVHRQLVSESKQLDTHGKVELFETSERSVMLPEEERTTGASEAPLVFQGWQAGARNTLDSHLRDLPEHMSAVGQSRGTGGTGSDVLQRNRLSTVRHSIAVMSVNTQGLRLSGKRESATVLEAEGLDLRQRNRSSVFSFAGRDIYLDFTIEEELGKGGFGTVYGGRRRKDGLSVAIKAIGVASTNPAAFRKELDQARKLKHPNIVRLLASYADEHNFYLVMELFKGGDLLTEASKFPFRREDMGMSVGIPDEILQMYTWQMFSGLAYLHYHYIAHRDIKCENYMRTSNHEEAPVKLIDLGIAGNLQKTSDGYLTDVVGTISTMAPEVFTKRYRESCDIWSLGITLYICSICYEPWVAPCGTRYMEEDEIARALKDPNLEIPFTDKRWNFRSEANRQLVESLCKTNPKERPRARDVLTSNAYVRSGRAGGGCCC